MHSANHRPIVEPRLNLSGGFTGVRLEITE